MADRASIELRGKVWWGRWRACSGFPALFEPLGTRSRDLAEKMWHRKEAKRQSGVWKPRPKSFEPGERGIVDLLGISNESTAPELAVALHVIFHSHLPPEEMTAEEVLAEMQSDSREREDYLRAGAAMHRILHEPPDDLSVPKLAIGLYEALTRSPPPARFTADELLAQIPVDEVRESFLRAGRLMRYLITSARNEGDQTNQGTQ
jgi:hypothetical protein